ncbi:polyprenyl synthetase family protein [Entomospira culicis]|uniref:Polyprenyl synthetase family protein n=1 Tax=Entomospira culicis TaxID=2719989 RepID=A0A968KZE8_9SPIO|nr:polyprenyl synthetase family protein [Entomospira culicis]NIZ19046.1 polyprenyl synthetase family protein [Entomospira culicis]NIZ69261.1 polyprenyl synthetase family protein [Entomospira culicis]WDI37844.1 polyprenyl synthetase family protein [Entomospira culicis]WDI39472.1 polyprenyl synthetase family protein [Entomospira culicis]
MKENREDITFLQEKIEQRLAYFIPKEIYPQWWDLHTGGINADSWRAEWQESHQNLLAPMHDLLTRGGKRWRALSTVLLGLTYGLSLETLLDLAVLVEIPHNASLIVDDIEDKSSVRRGESAVHLIYGEDNAINSANFGYFLPLVALDKMELNPKDKLACYQVWHLAMRRVHMGQALDITWHNSDLIPNQNEYETMAKLKTSALAVMGIDLVATVGNLSADTRLTLRDIWFNIGLGFQILDDVFNLDGGIAGKERADDLVEGKKSLPIIFYTEQFPMKKVELYSLLLQSKYDKEIALEVADLLLASGVVDQARDYGSKLLKESLDQLDTILPSNQYKNTLLHLLKSFFEPV